MDEVRQKLASECDILEFSASIANEARHDELLSFVNGIVAKTGYLDNVKISSIARYGSTIARYPHNIRIESKLCNWRIVISFHENGNAVGMMYATVAIDGFDYVNISSKANGIGNHMVEAIVVLEQVIGSLDSLDSLLNSSIFNSYNNDIARYLDAKSKVEEYDDQIYDQQIATIIKSFRPGMRIKISNFKNKNARECVITKVSNKRLYVDNYTTFFSGTPKKTIEKTKAATCIANKEWSICDVE